MLQDVEQIRLAIEMIGLGARLQVLESEVSLPRVRLIRLYKELCGVSPPKGMLPSPRTGLSPGARMPMPRCCLAPTAS